MFKKINCMPLYFLLFFSVSAHADENKVLQAKMAIGEAFRKAAILTDSLTDKGKENSDFIGMQFAQKVSIKLDDFIANGLRHDASCEQIVQSSDQITNGMFDGSRDEDVTGSAAKKSLDKVKISIHNYAVAQCENLSD